MKVRSERIAFCDPLPDMTQRYPSDLAERAFRFACDIVTFTRELSAEPGVVRNIAWQLSDAGTSVAANYEEAKAAYSRREFAVTNCISLKEATRLLQEAEELVAIFTTIVRKARVTEVATTSIVIAIAAIGLRLLIFPFNPFPFNF
ncbi:MAG TPA: four helix bundle protein [Vicinamibacterales bacterium]|nr:four helix bundle protein [Vicinamibacterales bacterium]